MEHMWEESEPRTPMVGLLSMGSDPTASIEALAKKHKIGGLYYGSLETLPPITSQYGAIRTQNSYGWTALCG